MLRDGEIAESERGNDMPVLRIITDGEGAFPDLPSKPHAEAVDLIVAGLARGMESGRPSVMFRLDMPDGSVAIAQTSLVLFLTAADALRARYGDPRR